MKKLMFLILSGFLFMACEKDEILPESEMPTTVKEYVSTHFPDHGIIQAIKHTDGLELSYHVTLQDGFYLEFNRDEEVVEISGITKLPDTVIPAKILDFVQTNYSQNFIVQWEIDDSFEFDGKKQEVELDNSLTLEFNESGDFIRIDD